MKLPGLLPFFALTATGLLLAAGSGCKPGDGPGPPPGAAPAGPALQATAIEPLARALLAGKQLAYSPATRTLAHASCRPTAGKDESCSVRFQHEDRNRLDELAVSEPGENREQQSRQVLPQLAARLSREGFAGLQRIDWPDQPRLELPGQHALRWQDRRLQVLAPDGRVVVSWDVHPAPGYRTRPAAVHLAPRLPALVVALSNENESSGAGAGGLVTTYEVLPVPPELIPETPLQ